MRANWLARGARARATAGSHDGIGQHLVVLQCTGCGVNVRRRGTAAVASHSQPCARCRRSPTVIADLSRGCTSWDGTRTQVAHVLHAIQCHCKTDQMLTYPSCRSTAVARRARSSAQPLARIALHSLLLIAKTVIELHELGDVARDAPDTHNFSSSMTPRKPVDIGKLPGIVR